VCVCERHLTIIPHSDSDLQKLKERGKRRKVRTLEDGQKQKHEASVSAVHRLPAAEHTPGQDELL